MNQNKISIGQYGEEIACEYLKIHGYKILERNYRTRFGEIDIIAKCNDILVFIEVKTKSDTDFGTPAEMINKKKKLKLERLAKAYLLEQDKSVESENFRIDIISVMIEEGKKPKIQHFQNAIVRDDNKQ